MEGMYFYFFFWSLWLVATFLMKKTAARTKLAVFALAMISSASLTVEVGRIHMALSFFVLFFSSCYTAVERKPYRPLLMALSASGLAFAYAAFRLLALFDPVWIWLDAQWMLAWWLALISCLFHRRLAARLLCLALGSCQGEAVYAAAIQRMAPDYVLGSFSFLDATAIGASCLLAWEMIRFLALQLEEKRPVGGTRQP
ncbi:YphA family membrane protein [Geobacillus subterraneus]|uniref:YphA family membrane protein n=1 Tax=Geobacillus subterraneus TaxID=129338 RepID=UPI0016224FCA